MLVKITLFKTKNHPEIQIHRDWKTRHTLWDTILIFWIRHEGYALPRPDSLANLTSAVGLVQITSGVGSRVISSPCWPQEYNIWSADLPTIRWYSDGQYLCSFIDRLFCIHMNQNLFRNRYWIRRKNGKKKKNCVLQLFIHTDILIMSYWLSVVPLSVSLPVCL
jgi:hypothetical protein